MFKKILIYFFIFNFFGFLFTFKNIFAYDDKTTHPALTDEIVDFYNLSFPDKQLTSQQKEWIIEGSILEDTPPRWINHFYDPIYKTGWSGEYAGKYDAETVQIVSQNLIAPYGITPVSSLEWLHNNQLQARYWIYEGVKTWERGILEMIKGNEEKSYKILGYILHLIEDASVPEHTRNDTHAHELEGVTGDYGSPYEEYLKQYTRQNLNIASDSYQQGLRPIIKNTIDEYLISLAEYSNKYFFSKDTINDLKYQNPKIIREDNNFGYGKDESGKEFPLVSIDIIKNENKENIKIYSILNEKKYYPILSAYFSRLSRQAVLNGAGVIEFFRNEIASKKDYPSHLITYDFSILNYFEIPVISIAGESIKIVNASGSLLGQISSAISNSLSSVSKFFSGVIGDSQNFQQANIQQVIKNNEDKIFNNQNFQVADESINSNIEQNNNLIENIEISNTNIQSKLPPNFQAQLNDIESRANDLNNQVKLLASRSSNNSNNYYLTYFGGGGGDGEGGVNTRSSEINNTVAMTELSENINLNSNQSSDQESATSTQENEAEESATSTDSTATSSQETTILDSATTTIITTSTESIISTTSTFNIVISEILFDAEKSDKGKEFIELYNPASSSTDLNNWSLKYFRENSTSTKSLAVFGSKPGDKTLIPANGFLLIGLNDYDSVNYNNISADILRNESLPNGSEETIVVLYDEQNNEIDRIIYNKDSIINEGQSLERLAFQNGKCISAQDEGELLGNGCDKSVSVWEIRETPNPQNFSSLPEPRGAAIEPQDLSATSTDVSSTSTQILLSQLNEASSSIGYAWTYQEFGNGIFGKLQSLEFKMYTGDACQYFFFQEFDDAGYSQLLREFSSRKQNPDSVPDFIVRLPDGSLWDYSTCDGRGGGKITIEFNDNIEVDPEKYYRLYFKTGDASRQASFMGSDSDAGFGNFKGCNLKSDVGNGIVFRWQDCYTPNFDIYFVLKGIKTDVPDLENKDDEDDLLDENDLLTPQ